MAQLTGFNAAAVDNAFNTARTNTTNRAIGGFLDKGDLGSAKSLAFQSGNIQAGTQIDANMKAQLAKLDARQREDAKANIQAIGGMAMLLTQVPEANRKAAVAPGTQGYQLLVDRGLQPDQIAGLDLSNAALSGFIGSGGEVIKFLDQTKPTALAAGAKLVDRQGETLATNPKETQRELVSIFDKETGREQKGFFDPVTGAFTPVGGQRAKSANGFDALATEMSQARLDKLKADAEALRQRVSEGRQKAKTEEDKRRFIRANALAQSATVARDAGRVLKLFNNKGLLSDGDVSIDELRFGPINSAKAVSRAALAKTPGTREFEMQKLIDSITSNLAIKSLLNIKREGSGLGQVPQQQLLLLGRMFGDLSISRHPAFLKKDIEDIITIASDIANGRDNSLARRPELQQIMHENDLNLFGEGVLTADQVTGGLSDGERRALGLPPAAQTDQQGQGNQPTDQVYDINGNPL